MSILPDILEPGLDIVFCGSAAGAVSARMGAYYAGPGNAFWPTLHRIGLTPERLEPERFAELPRWGLGLTDLCQTDSGADAALPPGADDPDALRAKIERFQPRCLAFVGKRPARVFLDRRIQTGLQPETIGKTAIWVLPSPSGAARRWWDEAPWRLLARRYGCAASSDRAAGATSG